MGIAIFSLAIFFMVGGMIAEAATTTQPVASNSTGLVRCGKTGQPMCTLCDLISGLNYIIQYVMKIAIGLCLTSMAIGGVLYIVSAADPSLAKMGKAAITNASIGFVVTLSAFLIINSVIYYLGGRQDSANNNLGINMTGWGNFECTAKQR